MFLVFIIGVMDMMGRGDIIIVVMVYVVEVYIVFVIIYYLVVIILEKFFVKLE